MSVTALSVRGKAEGSEAAVVFGRVLADPINVAPFYTSVAAMLAAVNAGAGAKVGHFEDFGAMAKRERALRSMLSLLIVDNAATLGAVTEELYLVLPADIAPDGDKRLDETALRVETMYLGQAVWTPSDETIVAAGTLHVPASVAFDPIPAAGSALALLTGQEIQALTTTPPTGTPLSMPYLLVGDIGPALGILRIFDLDATNTNQVLPVARPWL